MIPIKFNLNEKQQETHKIKLFNNDINRKQLILHQKQVFIQQILVFILVLMHFIHHIRISIILLLFKPLKTLLNPNNSTIIASEKALTFVDNVGQTSSFGLIILISNVKILKQYQIGCLFVIVLFFIDMIQCQITETEANDKNSVQSQSETPLHLQQLMMDMM